MTMDRRNFVTASLGASLLPTIAEGAAAPQLLELRHYQFRFGPMEARYAEYAKTALIPAWMVFLASLGALPPLLSSPWAAST